MFQQKASRRAPFEFVLGNAVASVVFGIVGDVQHVDDPGEASVSKLPGLPGSNLSPVTAGEAAIIASVANATRCGFDFRDVPMPPSRLD